jgi:hypothetical protein
LRYQSIARFRSTAIRLLGTGCVVDNGEVVLHRDQPGRCVGRTFSAGIACGAAKLGGCLAGERDVALDIQVLAQRYEFEQVAGAGRHAVRAGTAFFRVDLRQAVGVHVNRIERAGALTIGKAEAAPGATLAAPRNQCRRATAFKALVLGDLVRLQVAAAAAQPRDQLFLAARVDLKVLGDLLDGVIGANRALTRHDLTGHQLLRERQAARLTAGATIGTGQELVGALDARVFLDFQEALRDSEHRAEEQADAYHDRRRYEQVVHQLNGAALAISSSRPGSFGFSGLPGWMHFAGQISAALTRSSNVPAFGSTRYACLSSL